MRKLLLLFALLFALPAFAADVYVAQTAQGGDTGANCANAHLYSSVSYNTAGTTYHLCGTFSMAAGSSGVIAISGSGTAGNLVTIKFETGANATAPYWGIYGFILNNGYNYVLVDGGTNGTIQATANGTNLTYQYWPTKGVYFNNVSNSEIKNLTISNIYVHVCTDPNSHTNGTCETDLGATQTTYGIYWTFGNNVTIDNNTIHDAYACIQNTFTDNTTNVNVFKNNVYNCNWSIAVASGDGSISGVNIYGNTVHDWGNWDDGANNNHHDGIFVFQNNAAKTVTNTNIYNNVIYGYLLSSMTSPIYLSTVNSGNVNNFEFNNVIYNNNAVNAPADGYIFGYSPGTHVFNNTIVANSPSGAPGNMGDLEYKTNIVVANNIIENCGIGLLPDPGTYASSDYNDVYNCSTYGRDVAGYHTTLAQWQTATGFDAHSINTNPNLNASSTPPYQLTNSSSPAYRTGTNLTSYCSTVPALCYDATGVARPAVGAWDMGAYFFGAVATPTFSPTPGTYSTTQTVTISDATTGTSTVTAGPNSPAAATSTGGTPVWTNPTYAETLDGSYAQSILPTGAASANLNVSSYNFNIPSNATILGIQVSITNKKISGTGTGQDDGVQLTKAGVAVGTYHLNTGIYTTSPQTWNYGSTSDLWGAAWTYSDINNAGFGVQFSSYESGGVSGVTVGIDYISLTVTYSVPVNAAICYTIDGIHSPTTVSNLCNVADGYTHTYTTPLTVSSTTTIKALGTLAGLPDSAVATALYSFPVVIAPTSIAFGTVTQNTSSSPQTVTLTNNSGLTITLAGTSLTGAYPTEFSLSSNTCNSGTVTNGNTCTVNVQFNPTQSPGTNESATLNISYSGAAGSPQTVSLSGTSGVIVVPPVNLRISVQLM
jgi:hypothetical protein